MIQPLDQTSQRCALTLAHYKSTQDANQEAEDKLSSDTLDESAAKNSLVAVLNVLSGGHIQAQTQAKANGNLAACLAEQQTLEAKVQREKLADEQLWYADIAQARASSPALLDPARTATVTGNISSPEHDENTHHQIARGDPRGAGRGGRSLRVAVAARFESRNRTAGSNSASPGRRNRPPIGTWFRK